MSAPSNAPPPHTHSRGSQQSGGEYLCDISMYGIAAIAVMRCLIAFTDQVVFDVDPVLDPFRFGGLGPAGSMWLDVLLLFFCGLGLFGCARSGQGVRVGVVLLALIPVPIVLWHGWDDAGDLSRGVTWLAGILACVTVTHLARERKRWMVLTVLLLAVLAPLLIRGAANVTYEFEENIEQFEARQAEILADKGWDADSPAAQIFERRLKQRQPTAWFLTTNIYGSFMAVGFLFGIGLAVSAWRKRLESGWSGAMFILALISIAALIMTGSKGAILVGIVGAMLLGLLLWKPMLARFAPLVAIGFIVLALGGVVFRGAVLPEGFAGEKSLLFRYHYLVSSMEIMSDHPLLGVGADGFQDAYMPHRNPRNPEEVASAHSVFVDWLCTLGVSGLAWIALVVLLLWRTGRYSPAMNSPPNGVNEPIARQLIVGILVVLGMGIMPAILCEWQILDILSGSVRFFGAIGYVILAMLLAYIIRRAPEIIVRTTIVVAVIILLTHSQIEMTFTQPGSCVWAMCLLGLAGGVHPCGSRSVGIGAGVLIWLVAGWVVITGAWPATKQESLTINAAEKLWPFARANQARSTLAQDTDPVFRLEAANQLLIALVELEVEPNMLRELDWPSRSNPNQSFSTSQNNQLDQFLFAAQSQQRIEAGTFLEQAYQAHDSNPDPLIAATKQYERAARKQPSLQRMELLLKAASLADQAVEEHGSSRAMGLATWLYQALAELTGETEYWDRALAYAWQLTQRDPHGITAWHRLGDLLWGSDRRRLAAEAYQHVLDADANFVLDPLKQLTDEQRELLRQRLEQAGTINSENQ